MSAVPLWQRSLPLAGALRVAVLATRPLSRTSTTVTHRRQTGLLINPKRAYSTAGNAEEETDPPSRLAIYFWQVVFVGLAIIASKYSRRFYSARVIRKAWPQELQDDLIAGMAALKKEKWDTSERHFRQAWRTICSIPTEKLAPRPYMKIFEVAVSLGYVLEKQDNFREAYAILAEALEFVRPNVNIPLVYDREGGKSMFEKAASALPSQTVLHNSLTAHERMLVIALAIKLADMTREHPVLREKDMEKKWISHAVEEILAVTKIDNVNYGLNSPSSSHHSLHFPPWLSELAADFDGIKPFKRLATLYQEERTLGSTFRAFVVQEMIMFILTKILLSNVSVLNGDYVQNICDLALANAEASQLAFSTGLMLKERGAGRDVKGTSLLGAIGLHRARDAVSVAEMGIMVAESKFPSRCGRCMEALVSGAIAIKRIHLQLDPGDDSLHTEDDERITTAIQTCHVKFGASKEDLMRLAVSQPSLDNEGRTEG